MLTVRTPAALLVILAASVCLVGCTAPSPAGVTLLDTKSSAQLLRNGVAERVTPSALSAVLNSKDESEECGDGDPERRWISAVELILTPSWNELAPDVVAALIASYEAEGWISSDAPTGPITLVKAGSPTAISIGVTPPQDGASAHIDVSTVGACVVTDGAGSEEVDGLEIAAE